MFFPVSEISATTYKHTLIEMEVKMKKTLKKGLLMTLACAFIAMSSSANAASPCPIEGEYYFASQGAAGTCLARTPAQIWADLLAGNASYRSGNTSALDQLSTDSQPAARQNLGSKGQKPEAIILTCSDSRLPPEILFNAGLGKLFVVRVAGNIVNPHELGSIEYAVEHLGARLIVELGHENCGAVKATYDAYPDATNRKPLEGIGSLIDSIWPAITAIVGGNAKTGTAGELTACVQENVTLVAEKLKTDSLIIEEKVVAGDVKIYGAYYKLDTGVVTGAEIP
jgi:carbonic anhydrase